MPSTIVVALGGNALQQNGDASADSQQKTAALTASQLVPLLENDNKVAVVHGNGPQVGSIFLHESLPLDTCVAMSQGQIGYWLQQALFNAMAKAGIKRDVATVVTQVVVDENDPAFQDPTKPIGAFYPDEAAAQEKHTGFTVKEDSGRGWRRVVPSPLPLDIVEKKAIQDSLNAGTVVIAAGGGGIPVVRRDGGVVGIEGVIDKDHSAAKMAELIGADMLVILTTVDAVTINFRQPNETPLGEVSVAEMQSHLQTGQFAPGSMLPKVEVALEFVRMRPGNRAIITSPAKVSDALAGRAGTRIST